MKFSIMLFLSLLAFNAFSAEEGENQKSECSYAVQTDKRVAKVVPASTEEIEEKPSTNIRK